MPLTGRILIIWSTGIFLRGKWKVFSAIADHEAPESNRTQNVLLNNEISRTGRIKNVLKVGISFVVIYWEVLQLAFEFKGALPGTASTDEPLRYFPTHPKLVPEPIVTQVIVIGPRMSDTPPFPRRIIFSVTTIMSSTRLISICIWMDSWIFLSSLLGVIKIPKSPKSLANFQIPAKWLIIHYSSVYVL